MKLTRLILLGICGYLFGYGLVRCAVNNAWADTDLREQVHLNSNNTLAFRGPITGESVVAHQLQLADLVETRGNKTYPIYIVMDSPGGEVDSGIQFIEFAKTIPNLRTITIFAASMASGIVEGLPGIRLITGNGFLMFHRATGEFSGQFEMGEVEHRLALAKEVILELEKQNAARLKISIEDYKNKIKDEYWLLSKKAVLEKAADKVIDIVCSKELIDSRTVLKIDSIFGTAKYEFSNCPLFRTPLPTKKKIVAFVGLGE